MGIAVGVELTQQRASICVIEGSHRDDGVHFLVRHLERLAPKLSYPKVAARLDLLLLRLKMRGFKSFPVYINETAVGPPVVDLIRSACRGNRLHRVIFNHGHQPPEYAGALLKIGKSWLVGHLQVLLQTERLHLPGSPDAVTLAEDLKSYDGPPETSGSEIPGNFRVGTKDDLVNALGMAVHRNTPRPLTDEERWEQEMRLSARRGSALSRLCGDLPSGSLGKL